MYNNDIIMYMVHLVHVHYVHVSNNVGMSLKTDEVLYTYMICSIN